jgi:hypothetical protein
LRYYHQPLSGRKEQLIDRILQINNSDQLQTKHKPNTQFHNELMEIDNYDEEAEFFPSPQSVSTYSNNTTLLQILHLEGEILLPKLSSTMFKQVNVGGEIVEVPNAFFHYLKDNQYFDYEQSIEVN